MLIVVLFSACRDGGLNLAIRFNSWAMEQTLMWRKLVFHAESSGDFSSDWWCWLYCGFHQDGSHTQGDTVTLASNPAAEPTWLQADELGLCRTYPIESNKYNDLSWSPWKIAAQRCQPSVWTRKHPRRLIRSLTSPYGCYPRALERVRLTSSHSLFVILQG